MAVIIHDGFLLPSKDAVWFLSNLQLLVLMLLFFVLVAMYYRRSSDVGRITI